MSALRFIFFVKFNTSLVLIVGFVGAKSERETINETIGKIYSYFKKLRVSSYKLLNGSAIL